MLRHLLFILLPLVALALSTPAEAQQFRRRPPPHLRRNRPPPPDFDPNCPVGGCSLDDLMDDVQSVAETESTTEDETTVTQNETTVPTTDATSLADFPNDDSYANVMAMLEFAANEHGIPVELMMATAWTESKWSQWQSDGSTLVGGGVDYGLMQINEDTWSGTYDWDDISDDVRENILAGAEILAWSYNYAKGEGYTGDKLAQAAYAVYNGGPSAVHRPWDTSSAWRQNDLNFESYYNGRSWENNS